MNLLFFDCETNGLPKVYNASYEDVENWPRVLSLAWILADADGEIIHKQYNLIKPRGWTVPTEKFWIDNGYTQAKCDAEGTAIEPVLDDFISSKTNADVLVAHNLNFDHRIVWAEILRAGKEPKRGMHKICTMLKSTNVCKLPQQNGRGGYKWPKLEELHRVLFARNFEGAHDALADVIALKDCFFELVKRGVIEIPTSRPAAV